MEVNLPDLQTPVRSLNCRGRLLTLERARVMGILNLTPDSFYSESRIRTSADLLKSAELMLNQGASILDLGGQSTRPGATRIGVKEEYARVIPAMELLARYFPDAIISIDTFYGAVAEAAIQAGASIINDVSAGQIDKSILAVAAKYQVPYVLMHMQGEPQTMQLQPNYRHIIEEILRFFAKHLQKLSALSIQDVILDPGFGFGKNLSHNYTLLQGLQDFQWTNRPMLVGLSRKKMAQMVTGSEANEALYGSLALQVLALERGANLLRVHDVKPAVDAVKIVYQLETI